jgi:hypothetical protein
MTTAAPSPIYEELLDLLAETTDVHRLLAFRLSDEHQARLDELLQRNRDGLLTDSERGELEEFERLERLGRMLKTRARRKQRCKI